MLLLRALAPVLCVLLALFPASAVRAEPIPVTVSSAPSAYLKYLVVPAVNGRVPQLWEIALQVLDDQRRYREIYELNRGRRQPDGLVMDDPAALRPGWILVLPWDAVGDGVRTGQLPRVSAPASATEPARQPASATGTVCTVPSLRKVDGLPWAQLRLTPETAWTRGKGAGVTVAVLDSGIDASVPALAGRVLPATDTDCSGHGTAIAGILAAAATKDTNFVGIAPEAMILSVKIRFSGGTAETSSLLAGLASAVEGGARVAMVGGSVDLGDPRVTAALTAAVDAGTTVIVGAGSGAPPAGVLRAGAVGADDLPAEPYGEGQVDVVAPGVDVVSLGSGGAGEVEVSGTGYAVPFVAGLAALLAGSEPALTPAQITGRITGTADGAGPLYGAGLINIIAAVGAEQTDGRSTVESRADASGIAVLIGCTALAVLLGLGLRRP
ncbi:MAG TPA: S8 family serine peptidase [Actinoplanes sp.]|nr:S8 family serine peptidase [Actinoplanes sp.]